MKQRILCLLLSLLILLPLVTACGPQTQALAICEGGSSAYRIVYPEKDAAAEAAANALCGAIRSLCGVTLEVVTDYEQEQECEILIGETDRAASAAAMAEIKGEGNTLSIAAHGKKLTLVATEGLLLHAAELFLTSVTDLLGGTLTEDSLTLPAALLYTRALRMPQESLGTVSGSTLLALQTQSSLELLPTGESSKISAVCVMGETVYAAVRSTEGETRLISGGGSLGEGVTSEVLPLGSATSMCYNTLIDALVICHGDSTVSVVDPQTMKVTSTHTLPCAADAMTYLPVQNRYLVRSRTANECLWLTPAFVQDGVPLALPAAAGNLTVADMTADSRYTHLLVTGLRDQNGIERAGVFTADRRSTRYFTTLLPLDLTEQSVTAIAAYDADLYVTTQHTLGSGAAVRVRFARSGAEKAPHDLFFDAFMNGGVTSSGLVATKCFDTYTAAGKPAGNTVMQGGCTDGKYAYICMENQAGNYSNTDLHDTRIVKVDLSNNQLAMVSAPLKLHHSNDMCYNSKTGLLLVLHNGKQANTLSYIDPNTLTVVGQQVLPYSVYSIAYEPITDRYVVGLSSGANGSSGRDYAVFDGNFNVLVPFLHAGPYTHYSETKPVTQGIDCDSDYIYSVLGVNNNGWTNWLVVHDWQGNYKFAKLLPDVTVESENIFHVGNAFYVGFNGGNDPVYRFDITPFD